MSPNLDSLGRGLLAGLFLGLFLGWGIRNVMIPYTLDEIESIRPSLIDGEDSGVYWIRLRGKPGEREWMPEKRCPECGRGK